MRCLWGNSGVEEGATPTLVTNDNVLQLNAEGH